MPTRVATKYGDIFAPDGPCKDNYRNIVTHVDRNGHSVTLQQGAMNSFLAAERRVWVVLHPVKARLKKYKDAVQPILLTGSNRTCALQTQLYASDNHRYAPPDVTLHCRALAIDVSMNNRWFKLIRRVLLSHGWHQARPTDEPWHFSYYFTA